MVTMVFPPACLQPRLALLTDNGSGQSPAFLLYGSDVLAAEVVVTSPTDASSFIEKLMSRSLGGGNRAINTDYSKYLMLRRFSLERNEAGQMVGECMDSNSCQAPKPLQRKAIWAGYSRSSACLPLF